METGNRLVRRWLSYDLDVFARCGDGAAVLQWMEDGARGRRGASVVRAVVAKESPSVIAPAPGHVLPSAPSSATAAPSTLARVGSRPVSQVTM